MKLRGSNISMIRGDSESITVKCSRPFVSGDTVILTVREDAQSPIVLQKRVTAFDENGWAVMELRPEDTAGLDFGRYVYDLQLTDASGAVTTLVAISRFELTEEVTY